jgi:3-phenylpropionate/trans-cinnamate dioxygenase ferredoxin reductase component
LKETEQKNQIIILGGGQTACFAAEEIRKHDKVSDLLIISNEKYLPYQKPPLSKDCLIGNMKYEECLIYDKNFYINNNIKININETILKIDFKKKEIITDKKNFYFYNKLLIALGSKPNKIENFNHVSGEINYLRDINDSINIKKKMDKSSNILIIGAGFIGLEIASILKIKKKKCDYS